MRYLLGALIALGLCAAAPGSITVNPQSSVNSSGTSTVPLSAPGINSSDGGTISGSLAANGIVSTALSPAAPTVTATGGTGTAWYYCDTQSTGAGESTCSADGTVSGGATLSGTVYNTISGTVLAGASAVTIYQCSSAACTTTYKMGSATITGSSYSYKDMSGSTAGAALGYFDRSLALSFPNGAFVSAGTSIYGNLLILHGGPNGSLMDSGLQITVGGLTVGGGATTNLTGPLIFGTGGTAVKKHLSGACTAAPACSQIADTSAATTSSCTVTPMASGATAPCYCVLAAGVGFTPTCPAGYSAAISYVIEDQ